MMAQGSSKSGQKRGSAGGRSSSSRSGGTGGRYASKRSGSSANGARASSSGARKPSSSRSSGGQRSAASKATGAVKEGVKSTRETVANGAQGAGHAIGSAASKAKGPALAGGAAIAGLVGGMAIASRGGRRRVLGVPVPGTRRSLIKVKRPVRANTTRDLMKAAGHMGNAGRQMAELASEVRLAREEVGNGGRRRRSPVEVVLDGLTARHPR